jgi:hypothetical protein
MTGVGVDAEVERFSADAKCLVLEKPFLLESLFDAIARTRNLD